MKVATRRNALLEALQGEPETHERAIAFVAALRHDLGNLVSTFTMEFHILGQIVDQVRTTALQGDHAAILGQVETLADIHKNLTEAGARAELLLTSLIGPSIEK